MKNGFRDFALGWVFVSTFLFTHFISATEYFVIIDDSDKFKPANLQIQLGDTVTWINQDYTFFPHSATSTQGYWDGPLFEPDDQYSVTPPITGTFPYYDRGSSATGSITVIGGNAAPSIAITNLVSGTNFTAPATFSVRADASDSDGSVASVEFFVDATSVGIDTTANPYSVVVSNLFAGNYLISAVATDNLGATTTHSINISVTNPIISLGAAKIVNGELQFSISGLVAGKTNLVKTSTNLIDWVVVRTNLAASGGSTFTNTQTAGSPRKFFQVIQLP